MTKVVQKVNQQILAFDKKYQGNRILIACSAGVDSMVLLHACLAHYHSYQLGIVHISHGLRSCDETMQEYHVLCVIARAADIPVYRLYVPYGALIARSKQEKNSIEHTAHDVRYAFFKAICTCYHYDRVLLAHHSDDVRETQIMRYFMGNSFDTQYGMHAYHLSIGRPFLELEKKDLYNYALCMNISFCEDNSNSDEKYIRNAIRHSLLPTIEQIFPHYKQALKKHQNRSIGLYKPHYSYAWNTLCIGERCLGVYMSTDLFMCSDMMMRRQLLLHGYSMLWDEKNLHLCSGAEYRYAMRMRTTRLPDSFLALFIQLECWQKTLFLNGYGVYLELRKKNVYIIYDKRIVGDVLDLHVILCHKDAYFVRNIDSFFTFFLNRDIAMDMNNSVLLNIEQSFCIHIQMWHSYIYGNKKHLKIKKYFEKYEIPRNIRFYLPVVFYKECIVAVLGDFLGYPRYNCDQDIMSFFSIQMVAKNKEQYINDEYRK